MSEGGRDDKDGEQLDQVRISVRRHIHVGTEIAISNGCKGDHREVEGVEYGKVIEENIETAGSHGKDQQYERKSLGNPFSQHYIHSLSLYHSLTDTGNIKIDKLVKSRIR